MVLNLHVVLASPWVDVEDQHGVLAGVDSAADVITLVLAKHPGPGK